MSHTELTPLHCVELIQACLDAGEPPTKAIELILDGVHPHEAKSLLMESTAALAAAPLALEVAIEEAATARFVAQGGQ